jgi:hypothetical protein
MTTVRPLPAPPFAVPWGRHGEVYRPSVASLLSVFLSVDAVKLVAAAAEETQDQLSTEGSGRSHGAIMAALTVNWGVPEPVAVRCGVLLDILAVAVDLADDLADVAEDTAAGRPPREDGLAWAQRAALPALLVGVVARAVPWSFPESRFTGAAVDRLLSVLDVMVRGQGRAFGEAARLEEISAVEGRLYALPLWVVHGPDHADVVAFEAFAVAWARTWQARRDVVERPSEATQDAFGRAVDVACAAWPDRPGFREGEPFAFGRWVESAP